MSFFSKNPPPTPPTAEDSSMQKPATPLETVKAGVASRAAAMKKIRSALQNMTLDAPAKDESETPKLGRLAVAIARGKGR